MPADNPFNIRYIVSGTLPEVWIFFKKIVKKILKKSLKNLY